MSLADVEVRVLFWAPDLVWYFKDLLQYEFAVAVRRAWSGCRVCASPILPKFDSWVRVNNGVIGVRAQVFDPVRQIKAAIGDNFL